MSEGGWLSEDMVARANAMIEGLNAGLESSDEILEKTKDITLFKLREEQVDDN